MAFDIAAPGLHHLFNDPVTRRRVFSVFAGAASEEMVLSPVARILEVVFVAAEGDAHSRGICFEEPAQALGAYVLRPCAIGRVMRKRNPPKWRGRCEGSLDERPVFGQIEVTFAGFPL